MLTIKRKCTICNGDGVDNEQVVAGQSQATPCAACKGAGYFLDDTIDITEITDEIADIKDKVNDIWEKINE